MDKLDKLIELKLQEFSFWGKGVEKTFVSEIPMQRCVLGLHDTPDGPGYGVVRIAIPDNMNDSCSYVNNETEEVYVGKMHWRVFEIRSGDSGILNLASWNCWTTSGSYPEGYHDSFSKALKEVEEFYVDGEKIYLDFFTCKTSILILYNSSRHNRMLKAVEYKLSAITGSKFIATDHFTLKADKDVISSEKGWKGTNFTQYNTEMKNFKERVLLLI